MFRFLKIRLKNTSRIEKKMISKNYFKQFDFSRTRMSCILIFIYLARAR